MVPFLSVLERKRTIQETIFPARYVDELIPKAVSEPIHSPISTHDAYLPVSANLWLWQPTRLQCACLLPCRIDQMGCNCSLVERLDMRPLAVLLISGGKLPAKTDKIRSL